ncbi:hypothetical protein J132_02877 [Termitomyces sp. J132]|nr:hypothetical protein J132_02877 [Termitomyces sp. J132]
MLVFPPPMLEKLVNVTQKWSERTGEKEAMMQVLTTGPDGKASNFPSCVVELFYVLSQFHGQGMYMKGIAQRKPDFESITKAFDHVQNVSVPEFKANILFEYFPLAKINAVSSNSIVFRRDPMFSVLVLMNWTENTEENVEHELAKFIVDRQQGVSPTQILGYSNYDKLAIYMCGADPMSDKAKAIFADNYPRLQKIKKRYDPDNIFSKWFPITPP